MKILVGISSSIAAFKSIEIVRRLIKEGFPVQCILTKNSINFVSPLTFEILSGKKVIVDIFERERHGEITHIDAVRDANLLIVAPATANIIAKFANGIADDALSTIFLSVRCPVLIAPAMHSSMFLHPATQKNIQILKSMGIEFAGPYEGELASGDAGIGRMAEPEEIVIKGLRMLKKKTLKGQKFLITAGPTYEKIDPVRIITNRSSGKMGYAIAEEVLGRGGEVILISGPSPIAPPPDANVIYVESTEDMKNEVMKYIEEIDVLIMAAAPADFKPKSSYSAKVKKEKLKLIELIKTHDILEEVKMKKKNQIIVGFSAETTDIEENARNKMLSKGMDIVIANDASSKEIGFGSDFNDVTIIDKDGTILRTGRKNKKEIAVIILDFTEKKLKSLK
ncbi:MAG: bifunctional phosphopantothenoylcysteine decarboxylase/phosphopantothenate--cysteine ligase CoaBC [Candidatus Aminicenantia bacterium]